MKPAPTRVQLPALKKWANPKLEPCDWNFGPLCDGLERALEGIETDDGTFLVMRAFTWELERELGSGNSAFNLASELARLGGLEGWGFGNGWISRDWVKRSALQTPSFRDELRRG